MVGDKYTQEEISEAVADCHMTLRMLCKQENRDEELIQQYMSFVSLELICSIGDGDMEWWLDKYKQFIEDQSKTAI